MWRRATPAEGLPSGADAQQVVQFAYCEPVTAVAMGKQHLRAVGPEGLKPGGGVPGAALCGRDLLKGWDLPEVVTPGGAHALATPRAGDGHVWLCPRCFQVYQDHLAAST